MVAGSWCGLVVKGIRKKILFHAHPMDKLSHGPSYSFLDQYLEIRLEWNSLIYKYIHSPHSPLSSLSTPTLWNRYSASGQVAQSGNYTRATGFSCNCSIPRFYEYPPSGNSNCRKSFLLNPSAVYPDFCRQTPAISFRQNVLIYKGV